jgi:hypothetical protein
MRIVVDISYFLETSTDIQETKLKIVVLLLSTRVAGRRRRETKATCIGRDLTIYSQLVA